MTKHTDFPQNLVTELAERRCIIFLGAGASVREVKQAGVDSSFLPPLWSGLLDEMLTDVTDTAIKTKATELSDQGRALDCAQIIRDSIGESKYSSLIRRVFQTPGYSESDIHREVLRLDPKIVFTTNYDDIYERYCQRGEAGASGAFKVSRYYDPHLVDDLRTDRRLIVKLHGCVSDPAKTVLTRRDCYNARAGNSGFFHVIEALMLTSTILFVGCSIDADPHLKLFLEWASMVTPQTLPHYAITSDEWSDPIERAISETFSMDFIVYKAGQHSQVPILLRDLANSVEARRALPS
ncbi:SIR2 family NAD-dependent protein deacylase [Rhodococcus sp. EPR-134]|uniref:SIR2 family NAD-dependent protein deacylase n=1 Tax=Rhodococcus sp. EPR-134 TaxID=1813675 RepID=UPI0007BC3FE0|nr:SIR2 family protein [Rhodococcus sp. EPR-134]KZF16974.1 hypothetical protein A2J01_01540 [Rhodococcus sp. EPR-134]